MSNGLAVALVISLCLNVIFYVKRRAALCKDTDESRCPHISDGEQLSQNDGNDFHDLNHVEQENLDNHREQQENPIYGNISTDRRGSGEGCYEMMAMQQRTRNCKKPPEPSLNYASLDLKMAKKRKNKKHYHHQGPRQGRSKLQDEPPVHLSPPGKTFSEVDVDVDTCLPSGDTSIMVSHRSIYLNSQQIAQQTEEMMERGWNVNMEREDVGWDSVRISNDGGSREWEGHEESEDRRDKQRGSDGEVNMLLMERAEVDSDQHRCFL
ncbi:uncharacterized protein KZ484_017104 isoform 2-T2 [Pholidichthys leucotaenia]